jgi:hypothetical protein
VARLAGLIIRGRAPFCITWRDLKSLAASALTQARDRTFNEARKELGLPLIDGPVGNEPMSVIRRRMRANSGTRVTKGSGNVFADLGLPRAKKLLEEAARRKDSDKPKRKRSGIKPYVIGAVFGVDGKQLKPTPIPKATKRTREQREPAASELGHKSKRPTAKSVIARFRRGEISMFEARKILGMDAYEDKARAVYRNYIEATATSPDDRPKRKAKR